MSSRPDAVTQAVRAGLESDAVTGAVVPPIHLSTTYAFHAFGEKRSYDYSRSGNPTRAVVEKQDDPVLGQFLSFLAADMRARPERIQAVSPAWLKRVRSLVRGVKSDRNAPLDPSDE